MGQCLDIVKETTLLARPTVKPELAPRLQTTISTALADDYRVEERLVEKDMVEQQQAVSAPRAVRCVDVRPSTSIATQSSS